MSESSSAYAVSVEDHDNVRVLVLDRPAKLNAFTAEGYRALRAQLDAAAADPGWRCACSPVEVGPSRPEWTSPR